MLALLDRGLQMHESLETMFIDTAPETSYYLLNSRPATEDIHSCIAYNRKAQGNVVVVAEAPLDEDGPTPRWGVSPGFSRVQLPLMCSQLVVRFFS